MTRSALQPLFARDLDAGLAEGLVTAASDFALLLDGSGRITDVRARDAELQKWARKEWRNTLWVDTVTVESQSKVTTLVTDALGSTAAPARRQVNHMVPAQADLPVMYTVCRVAGGARSRTPSLLLAMGQDLRETFEMQRQLVEAQQNMERDYWRFREAEARYRNLFQTSSEPSLIVDGASLRVTELNPSAQSLIAPSNGKSIKVVGASLTALFAPGSAEMLSAALAAARSMGKHEPLLLQLVGADDRYSVTLHVFRQDQSSFILVRLLPQITPAVARGKGKAGSAARLAPVSPSTHGLESAYVRNASDGLVFTDAEGRIISVNRAFARLAELTSEDQARGAPLDNWLGRTGVELPVLLANLRENGSTGLLTTELRSALGHITEVEVAASTVQSIANGNGQYYAFSVRDVGRRLAARDRTPPALTPSSSQQLTELVGNVPLKQLVAESSDLIERLAIEAALEMTRDNRAMAAQLLGLSRQSLYVKLRRFGLGGLGTEAHGAE